MEQIRIFMYIFGNKTISGTNIEAPSFISNKLNVFYTTCLRNTNVQKFCNFDLFLSLKQKMRRNDMFRDVYT